MAEGDEFFALNPGLFSDHKCWSYNDLRRLSRDLGLGGNGKRTQLESKLTTWHRQRTDTMTNLVPSSSSLDGGNVEEAVDDDIPMNVEGSNFSVLPIALEVREDLDDDDDDGSGSGDHDDGGRHDAKRRRRSSFLTLEIDNKENNTTTTTLVSPFLLRPLRSRSDECLNGTPGKGILKVNCGERSPVPPNKLPNIQFSPFNGVRVIPHRSTFEDSDEDVDGEGGLDQIDEDEDEDDVDDDDVDEDEEADEEVEEDLLDEASEESDDSTFSVDDDGF